MAADMNVYCCEPHAGNHDEQYSASLNMPSGVNAYRREPHAGIYDEQSNIAKRQQRTSLIEPSSPAAQPSAKNGDKEERFLEYLSSSFNSGRPLRQERRLQRNKAMLMLIKVLFILFIVLYSIMH